jgi:predicted ferric reductase
MAIYFYVSVGAYGLDLLIRGFWGAYITRSVELQYKDGNIVKISCKKHPVANMLGLWKVGQYIFISIPAISVLQWHPFSVSSGPREQTVEVHIRGLGDHSDALVELSKTATSLYCRVDGPYGYHKLNYRRYPVLLMVGGGVGITPVIGIVKDLYNVGDLSAQDRSTVPAHCIEGIYVVWVMTEEMVYGWFCEELMSCYSQANKANSPFPPLYVWIYVTRAKTVTNTDLFVPGRPDFEAVFNTMSADHPNKSTVVFACGPAPMVNDCWDRSVDRKKNGQRFDFHHETFDF